MVIFMILIMNHLEIFQKNLQSKNQINQNKFKRNDGKDCLKIIENKIKENKKYNYKLIFMDIVMPKMNRIEQLKKFKKFIMRIILKKMI